MSKIILINFWEYFCKISKIPFCNLILNAWSELISEVTVHRSTIWIIDVQNLPFGQKKNDLLPEILPSLLFVAYSVFFFSIYDLMFFVMKRNFKKIFFFLLPQQPLKNMKTLPETRHEEGGALFSVYYLS